MMDSDKTGIWAYWSAMTKHEPRCVVVSQRTQSGEDRNQVAGIVNGTLIDREILPNFLERNLYAVSLWTYQ